MKKQYIFILLTFFVIDSSPAKSTVDWPSFTSVHKPWTRWWWHGNAVDSLEIKRHLQEFARAGIGGVEVTSIYGVKGREDDFISYLSPQYLEVLGYTAEQAALLNLGFDMPPGSGWRCGGLGLEKEFADAIVVIHKDTVQVGENVFTEFERTPQAAMAFSASGEKMDLLPLIKNNRLSWSPEKGTWLIYLVSQQWSGANVKRPAPGGEGYSFNPYSRSATEQMLVPFSTAFERLNKKNIRAIFHDSFEYTGNWMSDFFEEFESRRGYDLREFLPEFTGQGDPDVVRRVKCDYRETISDLVIQHFIQPLKAWSNERGWLLRNQSHGSPANLLDLYGLVDIPETEIFRFDHDARVLKFASSAAHVTGKTLVSAESYTWQDEHFQVTLDTMKRSADLLFASGVNHIFFHGTTYSPQNADWPGWLFYASSQINPQNPLWRDLPAFNAYITRCQSLLQTSWPDNDVLVYWPVYDVWSDPEGLNLKLAIHHPQWITENPAGYVAKKLSDMGVSYDFVSDDQLKLAQVQGSRVLVSHASYQSIIIPDCEYMPIETLKLLTVLAKNGATIVFENGLPQNVPGLNNRQSRQKLLSEMLTSLQPDSSGICPVGRGQMICAETIGESMERIGLRGEPIADNRKILWFRKKHDSGYLYFIANHSDQSVENWLPLQRRFVSAFIFDPMTGKIGAAKSKADNIVYLQLEPGESLFIKTFDDKVSGTAWTYWHQSGPADTLNNTWDIDFIDGGPVLPQSFQLEQLASWTRENDPESKRFAGTACYHVTFDAPQKDHKYYRLDLGDVAESAHVRLNGRDVGTVFTRPFSLNVELKPTGNRLDVEVTNLAANRIRDLDRRGVEWRIFHDINFVNINYRPFDASQWPVRESGLLGPVTLTPISKEF